MKGIILAGGQGTRLYPITKGVSKQLLPVYDKPMVYYPLSMLMLAGICEILVISNPEHLAAYESLLGSGEQLGLQFSYAGQAEPRGIADAFNVAAEHMEPSPVCLILGDNIFFGHDLPKQLRAAAELTEGAQIFAYQVSDANRYGVVEVGADGMAVSIEEKPSQPKSDYAIPGLYFYDQKVWDYMQELNPSARGELEITDINRRYMQNGELRVETLGRGVAWLDAGTHTSLLQSANYVQAVEERQGMMISCVEEIAFRMGFIDQEQLRALAGQLGDNRYRDYLLKIAG